MKTLFKNIALLGILGFLSISSFAHFGPRGFNGGGVNAYTTFGDSAIYIGTFEGGVYVSTKPKGSEITGWTARPVGLKSGKITALAHTGKYLFAATADSGIFRFTGFVGNDRYWEKVNTGLGNLKVTSLVAVDSSTVLAGTNGGGIFRTTNKGANWVAVNNAILHHEEITALVKAGERIIHTSIDGGVYASDDKGDSWIAFNDASTDDITATALSYNATTDEILVINQNGLFKASSASTTTSPSYVLADAGFPVGTIVSSISNDGTNWYAVTNKGVFTTPATAISWTAISTGTLADPTALIPFRGGIVLGTKNNGIHRTTFPATNWTEVRTGFFNLATNAIANAGPLTVVIANEKGVFVSTEKVPAYTAANKGLTDSLNVNDLVFADFCVLAATKNAGIFFSPDTGKSWTAINNGLTSMNVKKVFFSNNRKYAICADGMVFSSAFHSSDWTSEQFDLPMSIKPTWLTFFGDKLVLSTLGNGVFVKSISGNSWSASNSGLSNLQATSVTYSLGKVFVGTAGSGVFVSDTAAISWIATAPLSISHTTMIGLDGSYIQAMASNLGYVFASHKGGLLATSDNGATWIAGGNQFNLPSYANVYNITFSTGSAGRVFVTTPNNGIYANALSELPVLPTGLFDSFVAKNNAGIRVSPNPSNGTFSLNIDANVESVEVVNYAGQAVKQLPSISNQTVNLEATKGIYLVRAKTANGVLVQKIIVE